MSVHLLCVVEPLAFATHNECFVSSLPIAYAILPYLSSFLVYLSIIILLILCSARPKKISLQGMM